MRADPTAPTLTVPGALPVPVELPPVLALVEWTLSFHPLCGYTVGIWDRHGDMLDGGSWAEPQRAVDEAVALHGERVARTVAGSTCCHDSYAPPARTPRRLGRVWIEGGLAVATLVLLWLTVGQWLR